MTPGLGLSSVRGRDSTSLGSDAISPSVDQGFANLAAHCNHLESFKEHRCLGPAPGHSDSAGLGSSLGHGRAQSFLGDSNSQQSLGSPALEELRPALQERHPALSLLQKPRNNSNLSCTHEPLQNPKMAFTLPPGLSPSNEKPESPRTAPPAARFWLVCASVQARCLPGNTGCWRGCDAPQESRTGIRLLLASTLIPVVSCAAHG